MPVSTTIQNPALQSINGPYDVAVALGRTEPIQKSFLRVLDATSIAPKRNGSLHGGAVDQKIRYQVPLPADEIDVQAEGCLVEVGEDCLDKFWQ